MRVKPNSDERRRAYGKAARRRKRSRRRYMTYCLIAAAMMLCLGVALSLTVLFHIADISVEGESRYPTESIIAASDIHIDDNLFRIDTDGIKERIIEQFPYVADVKVQRVLPDGVLLKITEAKVKTAIESNGKFFLLSEAGRVLETDNTCPEKMARTVGLSADGLDAGKNIREDDKERFKILLRIQSAIEENSIEDIDVIDLRDTLNIWLLYDGRIAVELGSSVDCDYKIRAAGSIIASSVEKATVGIIDVSAKPVMRLREQNIYDPNIWPFPEEMCDDYKRAIPKKLPKKKDEPAVQNDSSSQMPSAENAASSSDEAAMLPKVTAQSHSN